MSGATTVLREYGQALRGDWADFDGRSGLAALEQIADWIDNPVDAPDLAAMRQYIGVCPHGRGHWAGEWYCDDSCEAQP